MVDCVNPHVQKNNAAYSSKAKALGEQYNNVQKAAAVQYLNILNL
jgi:hypothetical protein